MRFSEMADYRNSVWKILVSDYFQALVGRDQAVLDLGSGWGEFINNLSANQKYAMDLNPESRQRLDEGIHFLEQDCSQSWALPDESLDVIFTSNFFEHLPTKQCLLDTLREAQRCLKPGGRIICLGPNIKYLPGAYWDFFDHYLPLTELSMVEALKMADLEVESVVPRFLPYTMANGSQPPLFLLKLFLKLPLVWPLVGRQFLVVGTK